MSISMSPCSIPMTGFTNWGGNPREQHPRRSCPWWCAAGFPVSPTNLFHFSTRYGKVWPGKVWTHPHDPMANPVLIPSGSVKSCRLEDDFLCMIWTRIAFKWMTHISHIQNVYIGHSFVCNSFIKCMFVWCKWSTWWPAFDRRTVYCAMPDWSNQQWTE